MEIIKFTEERQVIRADILWQCDWSGEAGVVKLVRTEDVIDCAGVVFSMLPVFFICVM